MTFSPLAAIQHLTVKLKQLYRGDVGLNRRSVCTSTGPNQSSCSWLAAMREKVPGMGSIAPIRTHTMVQRAILINAK
jgi:hypothetical protein